MKKIIGLCIVIVSLLSCINKINEEKPKSIEANKQALTFFHFPDTVKINNLIDGKLIYNLNFTDYKKDDIIESRYIYLIVNVDDEDLLSFEEINNKRLLGFIDTLSTGEFKFKAVFTKKGNQVLNLAIQDNVIFKNNEYKDNPDTVNVYKKELTISKTVFVED